MKRTKFNSLTIFSLFLFLSIAIIFCFISPTDDLQSLKQRLEFSNILNIIYLGLAILFTYLNIRLKSPKNIFRDFRIPEITSYAFALAYAIIVFITSGNLNRYQEGKIATLTYDAIKMKDNISSMDSSTQKLKNDYIKESIKLEEEKVKRLKLEKEVSPRTIPLEYFLDLSKYNNVDIALESVDEIEAIRFSRDLYSGFMFAGWDIKSTQLNSDFLDFVEGVKIYLNPKGTTKDAGLELKSVLQKNNISSDIIIADLTLDEIIYLDTAVTTEEYQKIRMENDSLRNKNLIIVRVGFKPAIHFLSKNGNLSDFTLNDLKNYFKQIIDKVSNNSNYMETRLDSIRKVIINNIHKSKADGLAKDSLDKLIRHYEIETSSFIEEERAKYFDNYQDNLIWVINQLLNKNKNLRNVLNKKGISESKLKSITASGDIKDLNFIYQIIINNH